MKPQSYSSHSNCTMCTYIKGRDIATQGSNQICMRDLFTHEDCASLKFQNQEAPWIYPCCSAGKKNLNVGTGELKLDLCKVIMNNGMVVPLPELKMLWIK